MWVDGFYTMESPANPQQLQKQYPYIFNYRIIYNVRIYRLKCFRGHNYFLYMATLYTQYIKSPSP